MCGIAGLVNLNDGIPPGLEELKPMIHAVHHRGPDGYGYFHDQHVGLAHARLSIIDLTGGDQPIHNEDRSVQVVFNGEIFNYVELREDLRAHGHVFRTESDTEVILEAYRRGGADCVEQFNGPFAFALWDAPRRRLLLAQWLQQQGVPALPASQLDELSRRLESGAPGGAADLAGGWQLSWKGGELVLQQRAAEH